MKTFYYIYYLIDPRTDLPFYVGKGKHTPGRSARWKNHISEAGRWTETCKWGNVQKLKIIKEILATGMDPTCNIISKNTNQRIIFQEERRHIAKYGRLVNSSGILTNLTKGGEGIASLVEYNKETNRKQNGKNNSMFGKKHTEQSKQRMKETRRRRIQSGDIVPTKHTGEWKQHLRENNPGGKITSKEVCQISTEGEIIETWPSARQAGLALKIKSWRNISNAIKRKNHTVDGFYWRWKTSIDIKSGKLITDELNTSRKREEKASKKVEQLDEKRNAVGVWKSISEASRQTNILISSIAGAIQRGGKSSGFYWRFV